MGLDILCWESSLYAPGRDLHMSISAPGRTMGGAVFRLTACSSLLRD